MTLYAKVAAAGGDILAWGFDEKALRSRVLPNVSLPADLPGDLLRDFGIWEIPFAAPPAPASPVQKLRLTPPIWNEDNTALVRQFTVAVRALDEILAWIENEHMRLRAQVFTYDFTSMGVQATNVLGVSQPAGIHVLQMGKKDIENWQLALLGALASKSLGLGGELAPLRMLDNLNVQTTADQSAMVLLSVLGRGAKLLFNAGGLKDMVRGKFDETGTLIDEAGLLAIDLTSDWLAPS